MDYQNELLALKGELQERLPAFMNQSLEKVGFRIIPKAQLDQIRQDLNLQVKEKKSEFLSMFPSAFLSYISNQTSNPQTVSELFSQSFFLCDQPVFRRHSVLQTLVSEMNQAVHKFFMLKKQHLEDIIDVQNSQQTVPSHIDKFIKRDQQQRLQKQQQQYECKKEEKQQNSFISCLCTITYLGDLQESIVNCRICRRQFHRSCLKVTQSQQRQFVCPECVLFKMDMLSPVVSVLSAPSIFQPTNHAPGKSMSFTINNDNNIMEVRCIKLDGINSDEMTWPDIGELTLNGKQLCVFKPLRKNSSLRKRKDIIFSTTELLRNSVNTIIIHEATPTPEEKSAFRIKQRQIYFIGVYLIVQLTPQMLIKNILDDPSSWVTIQMAKNFIIKQKISKEVQVQLTCQFDGLEIQTPVRGLFCTHIQCFSLENYIKITHSVRPRRWRCPICSKKCFLLQIDGYQWAVLKTIHLKNLSLQKITFTANGDIKEITLEQEDIQLLPHYIVNNENHVFWIENLQLQANQCRTRTNHNIAKPILLQEDDQDDKIPIPKPRKVLRQQLNYTNFEPEDRILCHVFGNSNKWATKGYSDKDPIPLE